MAFDIILELLIIAIAYVAFTVFAQRRLGNYKRIKEIRNEMNLKMKELKQMGKDISQEVMMAKQKEIMALTSEQMKHQMKSTFLILPVSILLYYFLLPTVFPTAPNVTILTYTVSYKIFFIAVAFCLGLLSTGLLSLYERMAARRQAKQPLPTQ